MNYKVIDMNHYDRKDVFEHFTKAAKCSISITHRIDASEWKKYEVFQEQKEKKQEAEKNIYVKDFNCGR